MNPTATTATAVIARLRTAAIVLFGIAVVVTVVGWPRTLACDEDGGPVCDGDSGSWVAVAIGSALGVAAFVVFVVWAAAIGTRLGNRADREALAQHESDVSSAS